MRRRSTGLRGEARSPVASAVSRPRPRRKGGEFAAPRWGSAPAFVARPARPWRVRSAHVRFTASAHAATPEELRVRIEAECRGSPFLVYRDRGGEQVVFDLGGDADG